MKRFAFAALIIVSVAACTKSNIQYDPTGEISLQPVTEKATKAAFSDTAYGEGAPAFNIWAWWAGVDPGTSKAEFLSSQDISSYIDKGEFVHRSGGSWGGTTPYYWPPEGSLVFAGYSPSETLGGNFTYNKDEDAGAFIVTDYMQSNDIARTVDLMWFDITDRSYNTSRNKVGDKDVNGVPVVFQHALSWLQFRFQIKEASGIYQNWLITDIRLTGVDTKADFQSNATSKWTGHEDPKEIHVWNGSHLASTAPEVLESTKDGVVVIPQTCASPKSLVVTYNLKRYLGGKDDWLRAQTVTLPLDKGIDAGTWLPGKKYIYTIVFGNNEIKISPEVKDWEDRGNVEIEVQ